MISRGPESMAARVQESSRPTWRLSADGYTSARSSTRCVKVASTETSYCMRTFMLFSPTLRRIYKVQIRRGRKNVYNDPAETATPATDTDADSIFASFGKV